jgi:hypothetical protein
MPSRKKSKSFQESALRLIVVSVISVLFFTNMISGVLAMILVIAAAAIDLGLSVNR